MTAVNGPVSLFRNQRHAQKHAFRESEEKGEYTAAVRSDGGGRGG